MFSRAKRFNYSQPEDLSASLTECSRNHPVYSPATRQTAQRRSFSKSTSKIARRRPSQDFDEIFQNLQQLGDKIHQIANSTRSSGYCGSSEISSPPSDEGDENFQNMDELCKTIAELVIKKMEEKKEKSVWQKGKELWNSTKKVFVDFVNN